MVFVRGLKNNDVRPRRSLCKRGAPPTKEGGFFLPQKMGDYIKTGAQKFVAPYISPIYLGSPFIMLPNIGAQIL